MSIVTLTTDWQKHDHYIGIVKGKLLQRNPQINIVDLNHCIGPHDIGEASFVLSNSYHYFPENSIHIIGVNSELNKKRSLLLIEHNNHFFICSDCGFPNLLFPDRDVYVYKIDFNGNGSLHSMDLYMETALALASEKKPETLGTLTTSYHKQIPFLPVVDENEINSRVIYIDSYSNIITNTTQDLFEQVRKGRDFKIFLQSNFYVIEEISTSYHDKAAGDFVALFNSANLLEIGVVYGNASELLNILKGGTIRIQFMAKKTDQQKLF